VAKPKRTSNRNAGPLIAARIPFKGNNFEGHEGGPVSAGWLRGTEFHEQIKRLKNPDYTVNDPRSNTPLAVHHEDGWYYPDTFHSPTTAQKQAVTRRAINVKSGREQLMEKRAAKRKAKADATEQSLWNK
jgi:cell division protein YceG involved in septum cleavage